MSAMSAAGSMTRTRPVCSGKICPTISSARSAASARTNSPPRNKAEHIGQAPGTSMVPGAILVQTKCAERTIGVIQSVSAGAQVPQDGRLRSFDSPFGLAQDDRLGSSSTISSPELTWFRGHSYMDLGKRVQPAGVSFASSAALRAASSRSFALRAQCS